MEVIPIRLSSQQVALLKDPTLIEIDKLLLDAKTLFYDKPISSYIRLGFFEEYDKKISHKLDDRIKRLVSIVSDIPTEYINDPLITDEYITPILREIYYALTERDSYYIIDLDKQLNKLEASTEFLRRESRYKPSLPPSLKRETL